MAQNTPMSQFGSDEVFVLTPEFVRQHFKRPVDYRAFVMDDLREHDLPEDIKQYLDE